MATTANLNLLQAFDALLEPGRFKDYGPNGLQVEGKKQVSRIVSGVTASRALIEAAIEAKADAIFVHHGLFWRGQDGCVTGWMKQRLALLLAHDINLFAYHLPLDAHPELGNNAQLGVQLGLVARTFFGEQNLGFLGGRTDGGSFATAAELAQHHRRDFRAAGALRARNERGVYRLRPPCFGALWRAGRGKSCCGPIWPGSPVH